MARIDEIARGAGFTIDPCRVRRRPRHTHARRTLAKLVERQGAGHVTFVLRTIGESANNAMAAWSETILAISDIVRLRPDLSDRGLAWMEAFDSIALDEIRDRARSMKAGPKRAVMRVLIIDRLEAMLTADAQGRLL